MTAPRPATYNDFAGDIEDMYVEHTGHDVVVWYTGSWTQAAEVTADGNIRVTHPDEEITEVNEAEPYCLTCSRSLNADNTDLNDQYEIL